MSFESNSDIVKCKAFISEEEINERNKRRQEEWEKVRKPDDPLEAPEEEYDPKSLYERLQEQKDKKQAEFEESHRLKNLIRGLDDDEVAFLELVDKTKIDMETKLRQEELKEIQEYQKAVANLSETETEARLQELKKSLSNQFRNPLKKLQHSTFAMAVKRKAVSSSQVPEKKLHSESGNTETNSIAENEPKKEQKDEVKLDPPIQVDYGRTGAFHCLGVLPGLGAYSDSSDSENSSISDAEKDGEFDIVGRKRCTAQNHS